MGGTTARMRCILIGALVVLTGTLSVWGQDEALEAPYAQIAVTSSGYDPAWYLDADELEVVDQKLEGLDLIVGWEREYVLGYNGALVFLPETQATRARWIETYGGIVSVFEGDDVTFFRDVNGLEEWLVRRAIEYFPEWGILDIVLEGILLREATGANWADPVQGGAGAGSGPPSYQPEKWNFPIATGDTQRWSNCYSYALDKPETVPSWTRWEWRTLPNGTLVQVLVPYKRWPGGSGGNRVTTPVTCAKLDQGVKLDCLIKIDCNTTCPAGCHKVAMFCAPAPAFGGNGDVHFYRENADGTWSHKPSGTPAVDFVASMVGGVKKTEPITSPWNQPACRGTWSNGTYTPNIYSQFCGCYCVCSATYSEGDIVESGGRLLRWNAQKEWEVIPPQTCSYVLAADANMWHAEGGGWVQVPPQTCSYVLTIDTQMWHAEGGGWVAIPPQTCSYVLTLAEQMHHAENGTWAPVTPTHCQTIEVIDGKKWHGTGKDWEFVTTVDPDDEAGCALSLGEMLGALHRVSPDLPFAGWVPFQEEFARSTLEQLLASALLEGPLRECALLLQLSFQIGNPWLQMELAAIYYDGYLRGYFELE